ncbi:MAG: hypothetical protein M1365_16610 [Actinobacteria bacterium]|nr:hypothetical protein [Actinomycetota bacterium]
MLKNYKLVVIRACGRSGSIFLQSLFDNHPQILMFPMVFPFYYHWNIFYGSEKHTLSSLLAYFLNKTDIKYLFCKETPKSYICIDKKSRKFEFKINQAIFIKNINNALTVRGINFPTRKEFLVILHEAYAKTTGIKLADKKVILLHEHGSYRFEDPNKDFNNVLNIVTVREPHNSYASFVKYRIAIGSILGPIYNIVDMNAWVSGFINSFVYARKFPKKLLFIKTEDLNSNPRKQIDKLINKFRIKFHPSLLKSTYAGYPKFSDISAFDNKKSAFNTKGMNKNRWENLCSKREIAIIDTIFRRENIDFGYNKQTAPKTTMQTVLTILKPDLELLKLRYKKPSNLFKYIFSLNPILVRMGLIKNLLSLKNIEKNKYIEVSLLNSKFFDILRHTLKIKSLLKINV